LQLKNVAGAVSPEQLDFFRKVPLWLEWELGPRVGGQYNPNSAAVLTRVGQNPDKARGIEFNIKTLVDRSHPWMMMHELAHAYHHGVLGNNNADVAAAYKQAMERKLYDSVLAVDGIKRRAYAATNEFEYFAELSATYFGKNLYYPFKRAELKEHDPVGYRLMEKAWQRAAESDEAAKLRQQGTDLLRKGEYKSALETLSRAIQQNPKDYLEP